jgi:CelD/BcsL family acetyltransferase involved in cellulose biosynthesis
MPESWKVDIIEDLEGLRPLGPEWNEIAPPNEVAPWLSFDWMEAAATAYGKGNRLRIVTVRRDGRLSAVAPLVLKSSDQPFRPLRLDFLGGEELKEPNDFVSRDLVSLEHLLDAIVSERVYPMRLSRLPNDPERIGLLMGRFRKSGWITPVMSMSYPYLDLRTDPIRKSMREDLRRARRKAESSGEVRSDVVAASSREELLGHLEAAFRIESSGWKGQNHTAILSNGPRREFFSRYACSAWSGGMLRLRFLRIGGTAVAAQYAVVSARSYWLLNIGYDEEYRHCSPGNLLLEESIRDAARSGLERYNFLGKEEPWTRRWTTTARDCLVLAAYRMNLHGIKAISSDAGYLLAKRIRERRLFERVP